MTRVTIALPSAEFSVQAPTEVVESLRLFYPHSTRTSPTSGTRTDFDILADAGKWTLSRNGHTIGSFSESVYALLALEFEIENVVAKAAPGQIALHAGGVATESGAWLIAGHPDTGKTSSTFHMLELGQAFLCEEIALYEPATRNVLPYLQTLSLDRGFLADFQSSFEVTSGELFSLDSHFTRFVPRRVCESPIALQAILLPRFRPGCTPSTEILAPESVLAEFLGYCFPPQDGEELLYDAVIDLLEGARLYRITYGSATQAQELLSVLLASPPSAS